MRRTAYYVIAIHLFLIVWSALWLPRKKTEKKPLQVRMVTQTPLVPMKQEVTIAKTSSSSSSAPSPQPQKKTTAKKPASAPKAPKTAPKVAKSSGPVVPENLVRQLQESIAKIDQKSHKGSSGTASPTPNLKAPKWVPQLQIDEGTSGEESLFVATLIGCLQDALDLPEMGIVKVELTLKNDGSFMQLKVLRSESERNKKFLEQELKKLKFPPFSGNLKNEKEHVFVITFCNS